MGCVKPLCAGDRRTFVTINRRDETSNVYGGQEVAFMKVRDAWAKVSMLSGFEKFNQQKVDEVATHKFQFNWDDVADVRAEDQLVVEGVPFNIRSIDNVNYENVLGVLTAERGVLQ